MSTSFDSLRQRVRAFLADQRTAGVPSRCNSWLTGWDPAFSAQLAAQGWVGMCVPAEYGGRSESPRARHVVIEELLAAGAPVAAHWIADRQIAPCLLKHGTADQKSRYLPRICAGEHYFAVGLSEPDAGSDLAAVRTRAHRVTGGWRMSGTKLWTTGAHRAHSLCVLARTAALDAQDRHAGLTRFLVDVPTEGVTIRPIAGLTGDSHFNEVHFHDVFVADGDVLGEIGSGWQQVTEELAFERSGPERLLSTYPLLAALSDELRQQPADELSGYLLGSLISRLWTLRQLSAGVAERLEAGDVPTVDAAVVKDLGTRFEGAVAEGTRTALAPIRSRLDAATEELLRSAVLETPSFTLRGGTNEILRGITARSLALR